MAFAMMANGKRAVIEFFDAEAGSDTIGSGTMEGEKRTLPRLDRRIRATTRLRRRLD